MTTSEHDVIVAGGGTAGVAAAVAAARNGADTILIERYGFLGGTMTAGLVNPFMTFHAGKEQIIKGIFQEIIDRLKDMDGYDEKTKAFDNEVMKIVLDQMIKETGVKLLLHTYIADALVTKGNAIRGVEAYNKSGRQTVLGRVIIDATGDGDVAVMAGALYEKGREEDGLTQPMTLNFRMGGVDVERMPSREKINKLFEEAKAKGEIKIPRENVLYFLTTRKGEIHFNTTRIVKVDGTKADDLTYAEIEGRRQMVELIKFLKEKVSGFENAYLMMSAVQVGVRETRRIIGEYVLTGEDIVKARKFSDVIARGSYPIDIHSPTGEGTIIKRLPPGESYDIPYRCIVPKKVENLLIAGRCISCTHEAQAAIRVIPIVVAIGQAAGTAAALAAKLHVSPREMDVSLLQETLKKQGAILR
ncbi:FAD-dependent oxidoreductase [Candidatus Bathyarchaeota archaeon]|nr:MAG: FAD-dependent oxidoreductase [Candidatus Bathyarchaeota archaeon]